MESGSAGRGVSVNAGLSIEIAETASDALPVLVKVKVAVVGAKQTVMPPKDKLDGAVISAPKPVPVSGTSTRGRFGSLLLIESVPFCAPIELATKLGRKRTVTSMLEPGAMS